MRLPPILLGLALAATTGLSLFVQGAGSQGLAPQPPTTTPARSTQPSAALSERMARQAAERILQALQVGDASARFAQFAPGLQKMTTPALVASHMLRQPKVLRWTITAVVPGVESSTVQARLDTTAGRRDLLMVIDANGKLEGYHFDASDQPAQKVVANFIQAMSEGRYVLASSFLGPDLQSEIPPASLEQKWKNLQRVTGKFVKVIQILPSEHTSDMKLVIVNTEFTRLTDNLYVILDTRNTIIGVNFPTDPANPSPLR